MRTTSLLLSKRQRSAASVRTVARRNGRRSAPNFVGATAGVLPLFEPEEREHAAGLSLLGSIRIVTREIASGADVAIGNVLHPRDPTLPNDLGGKVHFVMRRTNARTQLHSQIRRIRSKMLG